MVELQRRGQGEAGAGGTEAPTVVTVTHSIPWPGLAMSRRILSPTRRRCWSTSP